MICTIVGCRPQFVKAAIVSRALRALHVKELVVHTGQHYDDDLVRQIWTDVEFRPDVELHVGSGAHGAQTAALLASLEQHLIAKRPTLVVVYGDTNTTLAASLAAAKLDLRVAHVEAGCRSYERALPEEINRVVTDHVSVAWFCPTAHCVENLRHEGIERGEHTGDVMLDVVYTQMARGAAPIDGTPEEYVVATIHRAANTDDPWRLQAILDALGALGLPVIFPVHPRTRYAMRGLRSPGAHVHTLRPLTQRELLTLIRRARVVITDSGGVQKEAAFLGTPCVTLRDVTEWPETVETGWNTLVNDPRRLEVATTTAVQAGRGRPIHALFGDGTAAVRIAARLAELV